MQLLYIFVINNNVSNYTFMAKSFKYKNDNFLDSSGLVHNKKNLNQMIEDLNGDITGGLAKKKRIDGFDFNEVINEGTGMFIMYGPCTNAPAGNGDNNMHWYLFQIVYSTSYCVQIAVGLHSDVKNIYIRNLIEGVWNSWFNSNVGNFLLAENGYQVLPSGLIIQWRQIDVTLIATEMNSIVKFPISFNHICFQVANRSTKNYFNVKRRLYSNVKNASKF